jgi:hypothetical protein
MSDSGTTSALFLQGAGQTIHVGDNVGIIQTGVNEYKFNLMANAFDMTDYQKKDLTNPVTIAGTSESTVEDALEALDGLIPSGTTTSNTLATSSDIQDAVNEFTETISDNDAYHIRQCKGSMVDIESITGGSIGWNQLIHNGNFSDASSWASDGGTKSIANNMCTYIPTAYTNKLIHNVVATANHVYLLSSDIKANDVNSKPAMYEYLSSSGTVYYSNTPTSWTRLSSVIKPTTLLSQPQIQFRNMPNASATQPSDWTIYVKNVNVFDLTIMFGTTIADYIYSLEQANAGDGVAWFRQYFPNNYYNYWLQTVFHTNISARRTMEGSLDCPIEQGTFNVNGVDNDSTIRLRVAGYIEVEPETEYCIDSDLQHHISFFATNTNVERIYGTFWEDTTSFTTPKGCHYIRVMLRYVTNADVDVYGHYLEIYKNGSSYPMSNVNLRGVPKLVNNKLAYDGDIYTPDGNIIRNYAIVDLGTLIWSTTSTTTSGKHRFIASLEAEQSDLTNGVCSICSNLNLVESGMTYSNVDGYTVSPNNEVIVYLESYATSTASDFTTAMNGVYLVYKRHSPIMEQTIPYQQKQGAYLNGKEEYIDYYARRKSRDVSIPVQQNAVYYTNDIYTSIDEYIDESSKDKITYKQQEVLGCVNLLPRFGSQKNLYGTDITVNRDGSVTLQGTTTAGDHYINLLHSFFLKAGTYILTDGSVQGGYPFVRITTSGGGSTYAQGNNSKFTIADDTYVQARLYFTGGNTNATLYPMIRLASMEDDTYVPYGITNTELGRLQPVQIESFVYTDNTGDWSKFFTALREHFNKFADYLYCYCLCVSTYAGWNYFQGIMTRRGDRINGMFFPYGADMTLNKLTPYYIFTRNTENSGEDYVGTSTLSLTQVYRNN